MAEDAMGSTIDARFGCALCTVAPCARAAQGPTEEVSHASGLHRSSSPHAALLTAWFGWAVLLHWCPCAARFRLVVIAFVSSRIAYRVQGCRAAHVPSIPGRHRVATSTKATFLRSLRYLLIIPMSRFNFTMYDFEIFTVLRRRTTAVKKS